MSSPAISLGLRIKPRYTAKKKAKNSFIYGAPSIPYAFDAYTGFRWKIPEKWSSSSSTLKLKFDKICSSPDMCDIINRVKEYIFDDPLAFLHLSPNPEFSTPPLLLDCMRRFTYREKSEWKTILHICLSLKRISKYLSLFAYRFKVNKARNHVINTHDVVTMELPVKPIYVVDMKQKCTYVYEASTLEKSMTRRLLTSDYMFVNPQEPKNLLSNEPFRLGQNIAVFNALKAQGYMTWVLDRYRLAKFNLAVFKHRNKQALKLEAISFHFRHQPDCSRETVLDFFEAKCQRKNMEYVYTLWFKNNFAKEKYHDYIHKWIFLARQYYEYIELNEPIKVEYNTIKCNMLLDELQYKLFNR